MATTCSDPAVLWGLFSAAFRGNLDKVKTLLKDNSLSSDVTDPKTGSTALLWASSGGSYRVVEWLVKEAGAKATHHNKDNCTAFYFACEHCHKPVAEFLVEQRGVDVNDKDNSAGHSPLHRLCIAGQTREAKAAEAKAIISWLITECNADVNAVDLAGRVPGEANLTAEAPNLQPSVLAVEIKEMLEDARQGRSPGTPKTDTSTIPSPTATSPTFFESSPVASDRPMRKPKPEVKPVPEPRLEPVAAARALEAPTTATMFHATECPSMTFADPVAATRAPETPPTLTTTSHATGRPAMTLAESVAAIRAPETPPTASHATGRPTMTLAAARAAATKKSAGAPVGIVKTHSPSSSRQTSPSSLRHTPPSPPWNSPPPSSRVAERAAEVSTISGPVSTSRSSATAAAVAAPAKTSSTPPAASYKKSAASPGLKSPSSSPPPLRHTEQPTSPPWNLKLRPGGVKPRSGNGSPVTASSVPAERGGGSAAPAVASAGEAAAPAAAEKTPTLVKQYSNGKKSGTSTAGNGAVAPSSAPLARFPRNAAASSSGSSAGAAAAVIGASHGPKASALAAAFENKARSRQASPSAVTSGGNGIGPSLTRGASSGSDGSGRGVASGVGTDAAQRSGTPASVRSAPTNVTPDELRGRGSVMQRTQIYVAAAKKGNQGAAAASKETHAPQVGKGKKGKEGGLLDKLVSMFTVSPESSPSSSPTRSASRSPQGKPRNPMGANGAATNVAAASTFENARMGFFHTNKSFKMDSGDKE